jgi:hypothetical protein
MIDNDLYGTNMCQKMRFMTHYRTNKCMNAHKYGYMRIFTTALTNITSLYLHKRTQESKT